MVGGVATEDYQTLQTGLVDTMGGITQMQTLSTNKKLGDAFTNLYSNWSNLAPEQRNSLIPQILANQSNPSALLALLNNIQAPVNPRAEGYIPNMSN